MKIDIDEIRRIAKLSRITLTEKEEQGALVHFEKMLKQMETLDRFDADSVPPTVNILGAVNVLREDVAEESMDRELLLKNAPERDENAYVVPRVVE